MKKFKKNESAPNTDNSELTYSELNFARASHTDLIHTAGEDQTTYAQIRAKPESTQENSGSEGTPGKDQNKQETAGGTNSKKSRCLGLVAILLIISLFAITIGLTVYVSLRNRSEMSVKLANLSETLSQTKEKASFLCGILKNLSETLCPSGWKFHHQNCYRFSDDEMTWEKAKGECESQNSHLLIINTEQEKNFLIQSMPDQNRQYFIGLKDRVTEGIWYWLDGTPMSFCPWLPGQPSDGTEHCGTFSKGNNKDTFGCNDAPCSWKFPFICEKLALSCIEEADFEKYCP